MGRDKPRMFKSTQDKEAKFVACLLANGPPPRTDYDSDGWGSTMPTEFYRTQIMEWWRSCHNSQPAITDKALHRFYNRYKRWLAHERYHRRREVRTVECKEEAKQEYY